MRGRELKWENLSVKERGYLFGLFEGDGYKIYDKKSRHYQIEFYLNSVKDKKIIKYVVYLLSKIGLKPNLYQDKRYNCKRIRVYSKQLFEILKRNINLQNKTKDFNLGFVSGLIDSEGHVRKDKSYIMIITTNKRVLEDCERYLNKVKIDSNISKRILSIKDKCFSYRMYVSVKFKNLLHLSIKTKRL
ncbi:LAGLIDADG family homing endonuclease [Patescibacteria group bacterium]|nr:LAGLIDADG family homing endonuclease [Patescibacteria group bacterium]